jgi:protein involved in polysaccharide export with SLBB domain
MIAAKSRFFVPILAGALAWSATGEAQITRHSDIVPSLNPAVLSDLNDVILFRTSHSGFQAFDGQLDADAYRVGPGDQFDINIWTPSARSFVLNVTPEGTLLIPAIGEIHVAGRTLREARKVIVDACTEGFPDSDITATLTEARRVRVHIAGMVSAPGTHELYANQRLADALARAGDILPERGSARHVVRTRGDRTETFDLLSFYANGDLSTNPYLEGGEHIRVLPREPVEDQLQITGAVLQPGFVEYRDGDRVMDLVRFAYSFQPRADLSAIAVGRTDPQTGKTVSYTLSARGQGPDWSIDDDMPLQRGDRVHVGYQKGAERMATVAIYGEVVRPGHYAIREDSTMLTDLIEAAGGPTARASPRDVVFLRPSYVSRLGGDSIPPVVSLNVLGLLAGDRSYDVPLRNGDSIFVPSRALDVQVLGSVLRPGILAYIPDAPAEGYIERAGGYSPEADKGKVRVIRALTGTFEKPHDDYPPAPGDQIMVPVKKSSSVGKWVRNIFALVGVAATTYLIVEAVSK